MILVLASGSGTNFAALAKEFEQKISGLICNNPEAKVIEKAKASNINVHIIAHKNFSSREDHEKKIVECIGKYKEIKLIILAGYMRVLTATFFSELKTTFNNTLPLIINLHPAPLQLYKGAHAYEYAVNNKFSHWGLSVHKVIPELDSGEVLKYISFPLFPYESAQELINRVRPLEHQILIDTVHSILGDKK
ncbi:formyltransferase family protein [Pigmentibacter sp. JX0631]|uniref:phosphoribosylglycinamide formyltransferase n=1 Tax=Pigmentibacter sp. JX0631 TaxID=2976982 RepID=UPI00246878E9|nr:formyltransferase family protein [Pigmentibacter sp. JX0631]WGL59405.1 formyltransferase family protein [Pigmentibacter sp. JX0631]